MKFELTGYYIELTNICNAKCYYCYNDSSYTKCDSIDFNFLKKFLHTIKDDNVRIVLSGGEPFLYKDIVSLINLIKEYKIQCTIISNGSCLNKSFLKLLDDSIFSLQLSVNSLNAENHDKVTGVLNSFVQIYDAIKIIKTYSYATKIIVRFLVQKNNLDELSYIPNSELYGMVDEVVFDILKFSGRTTCELCDDCFDRNEIYDVYHLISVLQKNCGKKIKLPKLTSICKFCGDESSLKVFPRIDCRGKVYPCNLFGEDLYCVGSIYDTSIHEIFSSNNRRMENFLTSCRNRRKHLSNCANCFARDVCYGGCPGMSSKLGNFYVEDPYCKLRKKFFLNKLQMLTKR